MIRIPRWLVNILAILFAAFHASLGISSIAIYENQTVAWAAILIYTAAVLPTIFAYPHVPMPIAQGIMNLVAAAIVPLLINDNLQPDQIDDYSVWYVAAIGFLMGVTAVRQHKFLAWTGFGLMVIELVLWAGPEALVRSGLTGAFLLVFAGHALSVGITSASRSIAQFNEQTLAFETEKAATSVARIERQALVSKALGGAVPMLQLIQQQKGNLTDEQKLDARMLEAALRDEIRGRGLMNEAIRSAAYEARRRGVEVIILDEGGLENVSEAEREGVLATVAGAIRNVGEGRITLRAPAGEQWKVTLAATRPGVASPDVWLKF
jgi:hypothetical protein